MALTRISFGSKILVTGDVTQHDRGFENNGLKDILARFSNQDGLAAIKFDNSDVERHPVIKTILQMYGDE